MKFCFWGNIYSALIGKQVGGAELQMSLLAKGFRKYGYQVYIVDFQIDNDIITKDGIKIYSIKKKMQNTYLPRSIILFTMLVELDADYYYGRIRSGMHAIAYFANRRVKGRYILGMAHDMDTLKFKDRYKIYYSKLGLAKMLKKILHCELLFNFLFKKANFVIVQHKEQQRNLAIRGVPSEICENIYPKELDNFDRKRITNGSYAFLGSLDKRKGIDYLERIVSECSQTSFKVIGRPRDSHAKRRLDIIKKLDNVEYKGQLSNKEAINEIISSEALISTSRLEGFPNTFLEAWANGMPVLSLYVDPGNVIKKFNLGECYEGNLDNLIHDIGSKNLSLHKEKKLKNYVKKYHSADRIINKYINIISENHEV